jgi:hypothetical protein
MSAVNERNISRFLRNPFSVYLADRADGSQPGTPAFYTEPAIGFNFNGEWVKAKAYRECNGVLFTVRKDLKSFELMVNFSIKETVIDILQNTLPGEENSSQLFTFDGTDTPLMQWWFESCFNDDGKTIRLHVTYGKIAEPVELATGEEYGLWSHQIEAVYDPADSSTWPNLYIES